MTKLSPNITLEQAVHSDTAIANAVAVQGGQGLLKIAISKITRNNNIN
jgi:hypothetical protein